MASMATHAANASDKKLRDGMLHTSHRLWPSSSMICKPRAVLASRLATQGRTVQLQAAYKIHASITVAPAALTLHPTGTHHDAEAVLEAFVQQAWHARGLSQLLVHLPLVGHALAGQAPAAAVLKFDGHLQSRP